MDQEFININVEHPDDNDLSYQVDFTIILPIYFNHIITLGNGNIDLSTHSDLVIINLGNGNINANAVLQDTCYVSVQLGNGNLLMNVPDTTNAYTTATVGNGVISTSGLNFQDLQTTSKTLNGRLGNGLGEITVSVGNGNLTLSKLY